MQADDRGAQKGKAGQFRGLPNATQSSYHGTMCEQKGGSSGVAAEAQSDQAAWVVVRSGQWRAEADVAARVVVRQDVVPVLLVDELVGAASAITVLIEGDRDAKNEGAASACEGTARGAAGGGRCRRWLARP